MTAPAKQLTTITERERLKRLAIEQWQAVIPGRVLLWKRGKVAGFCNIDDLADTFSIAARADKLCLSAADFGDVMGWLG